MQDFEEIYSANFSVVYGFVLSLCRDSFLAEEITQETFFKALKHIQDFQGNCKLSTWLCRIAKNTYFTYTKRQSRQVEFPQEFASEDLTETRLADREAVHAVHRALHRLREPYKEVFCLRTFAELSYAQIGALFDKTENWARVTYYRAKMMIKEELQ